MICGSENRPAEIPKVVHNTDDCDIDVVGGGCPIRDLQKFWRPDMDLLSDRIAIGKITPAKFLTNKCHGLGRRRVRLGKIPAAQQRNSHGFQEMWSVTPNSAEATS